MIEYVGVGMNYLGEYPDWIEEQINIGIEDKRARVLNRI